MKLAAVLILTVVIQSWALGQCDSNYISAKLESIIKESNNLDTSSLSNLKRLESCLMESKDISLLSKYGFRLAETLQKFGYINRSLEVYTHLANQANSAKDTGFLFNATINVGRCYRQLGANNKSLECFFNAQPLAYRLDDNSKLAVMTQIANAQKSIGLYDESIVQFDKSLELARKTGNQMAESSILNNMGSAKVDHFSRVDTILKHELFNVYQMVEFLAKGPISLIKAQLPITQSARENPNIPLS